MNLFQALTDAMDITLASDESASKFKHSSVQYTIWLSFLFEYKPHTRYKHFDFLYLVIFGEDVAFGGVFRCTVGLRDKYGVLKSVNNNSQRF